MANRLLKVLFCLIILFIIIEVIIIFNKKEITAEVSDTYKENEYWTITSYGDNNGLQMMSFTIEGNNHGLVIIDGGYRSKDKVSMTHDIEVLDKVIKKHNGIIDAWIITHFDEDHAGVFDYFVMTRQDTIKINKIYTPNVKLSLEELKNDAPWINDWSVIEDYWTFPLTQEIKVKEGDYFENEELIGLKMKVLSSYNDTMKEKYKNYLNNGSIVFKIYGNNESILFTSDIQDKDLGNEIIEKYREELKSDYIQIPHHGNSSISNNFYDLVSPKVAIFCSPEWIFTNPNNISWFTASALREYLESRGVRCVEFNTSPNVFELR